MEAKKRLGLIEKKSKDGVPKINYEKHRKLANDLARKALTIVRGDKRKLPLDATRGAACFVIDDDGQGRGGAFRDAMIGRFGDVQVITLTPDSRGPGTGGHLGIGDAGAAVIAIFSKIKASKGRSGIDPGLRDAVFDVLKRSRAAKKTGVVISFDSPYLLDQFRDADILIAGYDRMDEIQRAAADLLAGPRGV
jgi:hypothetical protein